MVASGAGPVTDCQVRVTFCPPPAALRNCITTFYLTEIDAGTSGPVTDFLHPEWANLRIVSGDLPVSRLAESRIDGTCDAILTGPTSTTARFTVGTTRIWGIGFLPLGWARCFGAHAADWANRMTCARSEPFGPIFAPLVETLFGDEPDPVAELARIEAFFLAKDHGPIPDENRILAIHDALFDDDVATVGDMAERSGIPAYTLERLCRRHFGFPPRTLLRRQRFMRTLSQVMLDPRLTWLGAMDSHYHDQAQFVRDFHAFMGMSPSEYAAMPHPVLGAVMQARQSVAGAAVQALHRPIAPFDSAGVALGD